MVQQAGEFGTVVQVGLLAVVKLVVVLGRTVAVVAGEFGTIVVGSGLVTAVALGTVVVVAEAVVVAAETVVVAAETDVVAETAVAAVIVVVAAETVVVDELEEDQSLHLDHHLQRTLPEQSVQQSADQQEPLTTVAEVGTEELVQS